MKNTRTGDFYGSVAGCIVAMILFNIALPLRHWTFGVILPSWADVLWAMNVSFLTQIAGNLILASYRPPWFHELIQTLFTATGLLGNIVFYVVFPLDFAVVGVYWLNTLLRVIMIVAIGVSAISLVIHLVRFIAMSVQNGFTTTEEFRQEP